MSYKNDEITKKNAINNRNTDRSINLVASLAMIGLMLCIPVLMFVSVNDGFENPGITAQDVSEFSTYTLLVGSYIGIFVCLLGAYGTFRSWTKNAPHQQLRGYFATVGIGSGLIIAMWIMKNLPAERNICVKIAVSTATIAIFVAYSFAFGKIGMRLFPDTPESKENEA